MTQISEQKRIETYRKSSKKIRALYVSDELGEIISNSKNILLPNIPIRSAVEIVGDTILGFHKTTELPKLFQEKLMIGADQAQRMTADLLEFLSPVIEREQAESNAKKEDIAQLAEVLETSSKKPSPEEKPKEAPKTSENIQPLRTMEADMNRIYGYGAYRDQNPLPADQTQTVVSNQDDILTPVEQTKPKLVETPNLTGEGDGEDDGSIRVPIKPVN